MGFFENFKKGKIHFKFFSVFESLLKVVLYL